MIFFKLFANCIPVRGASVSIICDLQKAKFIYIPNKLHDLFTTEFDNSIDYIRKKYHTEFNVIEEYLDYLVKADFGFFTKEPERFPNLSMKFETPNLIDNSILDINNNSIHNYDSIFKQLNNLGCFFLQLRFFDVMDKENIMSILKKTIGLRFKNIDLLIKFDNDLAKISELKKIFFEIQSVGQICIHGSPRKRIVNILSHRAIFVREVISSSDSCGNIASNDFCINIPTFTESLKFNTCLNKKISIDVSGKIKNCPSLNEDHGNVNSNSLIEIVKKTKFKKYWGISKDLITVCKDCQFRYICTDCRAFINNIYDKPAKCNYNPYTNVWEK